MAGFLTLVFNPQAWIAVVVALGLGFTGGVVKGWSWSNSGYLQRQVNDLKKASKQKDDIIAADAESKLSDQEEKTKLEEQLRKYLNEAGPNTACMLSSDELKRLQQL